MQSSKKIRFRILHKNEKVFGIGISMKFIFNTNGRSRGYLVPGPPSVGPSKRLWIKPMAQKFARIVWFGFMPESDARG